MIWATGGGVRAASWRKRRLAVGAASIVILIVSGGCATLDPSADYGRARRLAEVASGADTVSVHGQDTRIPEEIATALKDGVTRQEAVELALLNNKQLQAALYEIGVSRADLVQSGLLANPSLGAAVRFPRDGGDATVEARLALNLMDLWHRPARKRVQEHRLEGTVLRVAHDAAELVARTKAAYIGAVAARRARSIEEENLAASREFMQLTVARQEAGAATEVEANAARAEHLEQQVRLRSAELLETDLMLRLLVLLGLNVGPDELALASSLALPSALSTDLDTLTASALSSRLDLWAAKENVRAAEAAVSLQKRLFLPDVQGAVEVEARGDEFEVGPGLEFELPLFDRNQAQVSKAQIRHRQAAAVLESLTLSTHLQVRTAYERLAVSLETARAYSEDITPLRESSLELARESFGAGKSGFLSVLEAQRQLLAARRESNSSVEAFWLMLVRLEEACGRPLSELVDGPVQ